MIQSKQHFNVKYNTEKQLLKKKAIQTNLGICEKVIAL